MGTNNSGIDEREAFRLDDEMEVVYRLAKDDEIENMNFASDISKNIANTTLGSLQYLDDLAKPILQRIAKRDPELYEYIDIVEKKLFLLTNSVSDSDLDEKLKMHVQKVNVSETGIAFGTKQQFEKDILLRLQLTLLPSHQRISAYGKVVVSKDAKDRADTDPGYPMWTALIFTAIKNGDQKFLIKHMLSCQAKLVK